MSGKAACVAFHSSKHCFANIPRTWTSKISRDKVLVFEVQGDGGALYTSWGGGTTSGDGGVDVIEINGLFGSKQKLQHDEEVLVSQLPSVPSCAQLFVEPLSITDWEILELHASYIEANLLQQVRAVWIGQVIPIWVQRGICIFVKIGNMVPSAKCCLLEENSEVYVAPKARNAVAKKSTEVTSSGQNKRDTNGAVGGNIKSQDDAIATEGLSIPMDKQRVRNMSGNKFVSDLKKAAESYNEKEGASSDDSREDASEKRGTVGQVYSYLKSLWSGQKGSDGTEEPSEPVVFYQSEILHEHFDCNLRVQSLDDIFDGCHDDVATETMMLLQQQTTVFISPSTFRKHCAHRTCNGLSTFFATVTKLPSPSEREEIQNRKSRPQPKSDASSESSLESHSPREVAVRVVVSSLLEGIPRDHVAISDVLRGQLGYPTTSRVRLTAATHDETSPRHVTLSPLFVPPSGYTPDMLLTAAATWCEEVASVTRPLVVSPGVIVRIPLNNDVRGYFLLSFPAPGPAARYCLVSPGGRPRLEIRDQITPSQLTDGLARFAYSGASSPCEDVDPPQTGLTAAQLGGVGDTLTALDRSLCAALGLAGPPTLLPRGPGSGSVLVCGPRGAGRSVVALAAVQSVARRPGGVYVSMVNCRGLRGKRIDSLRKLLLQLFREASWRQPAVLLLDDLDHVTAAPSGPEQEMSGEATYYTRVAQVLSDLLDTETHARSRVVVIATARSRASLHPSLTSSHGKHYFSEIVNISQPDKPARSAILRSQLLTKPCVAPACLDDLDLDLVSDQTEGFVARDLEMVVERAIHAHRIVNVNDSQELLISQADLAVALRGFTPSALRHVSLHKAGELGWADVGGLAEVRMTLVETLQWPAKYPALFSSVPLRLRSGLLLYGAPGTGKTLLAGIVAKECGLNFISIKGPELLSKYIGASEQAVRDTFVRAQSAKPCILFFDEFDSLAPRRGHDSTGVTDRVVNQLLTQLDGVEGLQGVYVLGATSRPDLIDPALLRPGRLDKALHCPMPDQDERLEILSSLTRHMTFDPDVDLTYLAESCDHFTGADYKALLYNAQLEAIHEITGVKQGPRQLEQNIQLAQQEQSVQLTQPEQQKLNMQTANDATMGQKSAISSDLTNGNIDESIENDNLTNKDLDAMDENDRVNLGAKQKVVEKPRNLVPPSDLATPDNPVTPDDPVTPRVAHIPSLEEGSVELTAEQQQEILSLYTQTAPPGEQREATRPAVVITQRHLVAAARDTRPSVTAAERRKYRKIYENFVASRGGNFSDQVPAGGKKATLA